MTLHIPSLGKLVLFALLCVALNASAQFAAPPSRLPAAIEQNDLAGKVDAPVSFRGLTSATPVGQIPVSPIGNTGNAPSAQSADELNRILGRARGATKDDAPSQFQKFVQEATGTLLPIFGSQLFDAPQNYVPDAGLATPANYVLGPGDEVRVQVWGAMDFSAALTLDREGQVFLPKVGMLQLAGVTAANLEPVLKSHLGKVFANFGLSAALGKLRSVQVYVVGQARQPGTYAVSSLSTLVNVLFASGGPNSNGSMRAIELQRAGKLVTKLDLYSFIAKGDKSADMAVLPGDVIFIPPASRRIAVTGAYDQAAIYELADKVTTVGDILALGGGASPVASTRKALLERVFAEKMPPRQVLDLALDVKGLNEPLLSGDILTLLHVNPAFSNAVTLQGVVAEPLRFRWFEGMRVSDLIPDSDALITPDYYRRKNQLTLPKSPEVVSRRDLSKSPEVATKGDLPRKIEVATQGDLPRKIEVAEQGDLPKGLIDQLIEARVRNLVEEINWDYAVVERLGKDKLAMELISFNLGKAVVQRDPAQNITLQSGDIVTILSQKDLAVPQEKRTRLVRVEGEVAVPGIYQAIAGETLPQLIKRIGGFTSQAYVFGTEFNRESVRLRQQENLGTLIRRLEGQLQGQMQGVVATNGQEAAAATALMQQQQAQLQSQITRLKSLKSNGRLALELEPSAQSLAALPALLLEDGDRIYVPAAPGYVAAMGAVNNENAMIYKPGKTVGDVVRAAGTTDDAETDSVFVLRADGSVVSKKDRGGFFGGGFDSLAIMPGDTLVVPAKLDRESGYAFTMRALKDWTQIIANLGLGAAAIKTLRD